VEDKSAGKIRITVELEKGLKEESKMTISPITEIS